MPKPPSSPPTTRSDPPDSGLPELRRRLLDTLAVLCNDTKPGSKAAMLLREQVDELVHEIKRREAIIDAARLAQLAEQDPAQPFAIIDPR